MDPNKLSNTMTTFTMVQHQIILDFEAFFNDHKRILQVSCHTRHRIRQIVYFRMIHASDLVCQQSTRMDRRCFSIMCYLLQTTSDYNQRKVWMLRKWSQSVCMCLHTMLRIARSSETLYILVRRSLYTSP